MYNSARENPNTSANPQHLDLLQDQRVDDRNQTSKNDMPPQQYRHHSASAHLQCLGSRVGWYTSSRRRHLCGGGLLGHVTGVYLWGSAQLFGGQCPYPKTHSPKMTFRTRMCCFASASCAPCLYPCTAANTTIRLLLRVSLCC